MVHMRGTQESSYDSLFLPNRIWGIVALRFPPQNLIENGRRIVVGVAPVHRSRLPRRPELAPVKRMERTVQLVQSDFRRQRLIGRQVGLVREDAMHRPG